jgi:hypothetical protein
MMGFCSEISRREGAVLGFKRQRILASRAVPLSLATPHNDNVAVTFSQKTSSAFCVLPSSGTLIVCKMALALSRDVHDPLSLIWQWQKDTSPEALPDELGLTGRLYTSCIGLYRIILCDLKAKSGLSRASYRGIERNYGSLCLWGKELGVSEGNLDRLLDKSLSLRRSTLKLLAAIGKTLSTRRFK